MRIRPPKLLDTLFSDYLRRPAQAKYPEGWFIAKPCPGFFIETYTERFYHAYLVLVGRAQAYQYREDRDA